MKEKIKQNLANLFNQNFNLFKDSSFSDFVDSITGNNPEASNLNSGTMGSYYAEEEISALNNLKHHQEAIDLYAIMKENLNSGNEIIENFKNDILASIEIIKEKVAKEKKGFKNQIIFIEHDYDPIACFCGFGEGDYPILEEPKYLEYNSKQELFNGVGEISYAQFWNKKIEFEEMLEEADEEIDLADLVLDTGIYACIQSAYRYKTYLMLYEAFDLISINAFEGIPIKFPLYIYGNEHDCEVINIYAYQ